jgi:hypothetical protein
MFNTIDYFADCISLYGKLAQSREKNNNKVKKININNWITKINP